MQVCQMGMHKPLGGILPQLLPFPVSLHLHSLDCRSQTDLPIMLTMLPPSPALATAQLSCVLLSTAPLALLPLSPVLLCLGPPSSFW